MNVRSVAAPLWAAAFRPFFLLGVPCGLWLMAVWLASPLDGVDRLWHGHEMVFGFAGAIVSGIILTALPSWAGAEEIKERRLAVLVILWLAGRLAMALPLPPLAAALIDGSLFPAMAAMLAAPLARVKNRLYLLALPGVLSLAVANGLFHAGAMAGDAARAGLGLHFAVYALLVLYILKSGVMVPVFTANELPGRAALPRHPGLEVAAVLSVVALGWTDLGGAPQRWVGAAGIIACAINAARLLRWRGWRVARTPIVFVMHLGIAWLVLSLGLRAAAAFSAVPQAAWLHAFTVGGMGLCMTALMTRVVLRHTGRPLVLPPAIRLAYALMFAAAILRLSWALVVAPSPRADLLLQASAALWLASFAIYLRLYGAMLWRPSLPRTAA